MLTLETSGNQSFIFDTNKLRENVGASQLAYEVGTVWLVDALGWSRVAGERSEALARALADPGVNAPFSAGGGGCEVITAASGRAVVVFAERERARIVAGEVTARALRDAPGLAVTAGISGDFDWGERGSLSQAIVCADRALGAARARGGSPLARFQRLPIFADCESSVFPAAWDDEREADPAPRSMVSVAKRRAAERGVERMCELAGEHSTVRSIDELERRFADRDSGWLAVIHADGNGVGQRFVDLGHNWAGLDNGVYAARLRAFSLALDRCARTAYRAALGAVTPLEDGTLPVVPIVVGGDDVTIVAHGRDALSLTARFLEAYERETGGASLEGGALGACAGVAIVKRHFPFSLAYALAGQLTDTAKATKSLYDPVSAFDFHVLFDRSGADLRRIRAALSLDGRATVLHGRPYVTTSRAALGHPPEGAWLDVHHVDQLTRRLQHLAGGADGDGEVLPRTQLVALREALQLGRAAAEARYALVRERYARLGALVEGESLFGEEGSTALTRLLDVLEVDGLGGDPGLGLGALA